MLAQAQQLLAWEDEAEQIYTETQLALSGTVAARRAVLPLLPDRIAQLEALHRRARSFTTYNYRVPDCGWPMRSCRATTWKLFELTAAAARPPARWQA